jgi:hypothetical protein
VSNILRTPIVPSSEGPNKYTEIGLKQNPFPDEPSLVLDNQDPRLNGEIYNEALHETQRKQFDDFLIPSPGKTDVRTLVFLMDHATKRGRGIGKTVFLKKQMDRIMSDLADEASKGSAVILATHVVPNASTPPRKFWQFARLIFESFVDKDVITMAVARARALSGGIGDNILSSIQTSEDLIEKIGNNNWLSQQGVDVEFALNPMIKQRLVSFGVREELAHALSFTGNDPEKFRRSFLSSFTDYRWRQDGGKIVFHDLVNLFVAAEFSRGLLLIDEVEKIVPYQNLLERRSFVESLRYFLFDGNCAAAKRRFFGMLLTIHPGIQEALLPHWNAAGLDRLAPINEPDAQRNTIYFPPLTAQDAKPLVNVYLKYYRSTPASPNDLSPFDEDAIIEALFKSGGVPGRMLTLLHEVIENAAEKKIKRIDKQFVEQTFFQREKVEPPALEDATPLPPTQIDLIGGRVQ